MTATGDPTPQPIARGRVRPRALGHVLRWLALDAVVAIVAGWLALALRSDNGLPVDPWLSALPWVLLPAVVTPVTNQLAFVDSISWRRPSATDVVHISLAALVALGVVLAVFYGLIVPLREPNTIAFPRSYWPLQAAIALVLGLMFRVGRSWYQVRRLGPAADRRRQTRTLLYGAGEAGTAFAHEALSNARAGVLPVGFLDDDSRLWGKRVANMLVFGDSTSLAMVARKVSASQVLITMPSADGYAVRRVVDAAAAGGFAVRTVPSLGELITDSIQSARIRHVNVEDLLRRPVQDEDRRRVRSLVEGKRVLVTGAAGSIGAEIARQVFDADPALLVVFDQAESPLYEIERELLDRAGPDRPTPPLAVELGSVTDGAGIRELFARHPVDIVIHAAAYKHVPMLESHPVEAVVNNVGGTMTLLDAAHASGAKRFVLISTDKAVDPSSVMGATKRLAELAVVAAGAEKDWEAVAVRFGNVLGSAGSVIPIFEKQLELGAPLTITHPDATRFFMTIPEATQLVLGAASMGGTGATYVLKMGQPVKIVDLAHDLIRLAGYDETTVAIRYTGLRPGERLHETLFYDAETAEDTADPRILRASIPAADAGVIERLRDLVDRARQREVTGAEVVASARDLGGGR
jgi:FlaA1/EpsC-like NDP-sugar epimerase